MKADTRALAQVARRSIRRAPLRSLLIVALVAIVVAVGTSIAIAMRSTTVTLADQQQSRFGGGDTIITFGPGLYGNDPWRTPSDFMGGVSVDANGATTNAELQAAIEQEQQRLADSLVWLGDLDLQALQDRLEVELGQELAITRRSRISSNSPFGPFQRAEGIGRILDVSLEESLTSGLVDMVEGRAPRAADEIAVHQTWLERQDRRLNDIITLNGSDFTVVGSVVDPAHKWGERSVVTPAGFDRLNLAPNALQFRLRTTLGLQPGELLETLRSIETVVGQPIAVELVNNSVGQSLTGERQIFPGRGTPGGLGDARVRLIPPLIAMLLGALVAVVAATAFSIGVRRRTQEFAQLATTGADGGQLKKLVLLEAGWLGTVGAVVGVCVGIAVAYWTSGWEIVGTLGNRSATTVRLNPVDWIGPAAVGVVASLLAAWWPARVLAVTDLTSALGGHARPVAGLRARSYRRYLVAAMAVAAVSVALVIARSARGLRFDGWSPVLVVAGTVATAVAALLALYEVARLMTARSENLPLMGRLVARLSARHRIRTWMVSTSFLLMLAGVVLVGAVVQAYPRSTSQIPGELDGRAVLLSTPYSGQQVGPDVVTEARASALASFETRLRSAMEMHGVAAGAAVPVQQLPNVSLTVRDSLGGQWGGGTTFVASPELLDALEVDADLAAWLDSDTVMLLGRDASWIAADDELFVADWMDESSGVPVDLIRGPRLADYQNLILVSPEVAAQFSPEPTSGTTLYTFAEALSIDQEAALFDAANRAWVDEFGAFTALDEVGDDFGPQYWSRAGVALAVQRTDQSGPSQSQVVWASLAIASVLAALLAYVMASLAAVENDKEIAAMIAAGARPVVRRQLLALQTLYQLLTAAVLAVPAALIVFYVITRLDNGNRRPVSLTIPWLSVGATAVVIPVLVAVVVGLTFRNGRPAVSRRLS